MSKRRQPEQELQRTCVTWLTLARPRCVWFAVPNGGARSRIEAAIFKGLGVRAGVADLVFQWEGGSGQVELKAEKGRQSQSQKDWELYCAENGVPYRVVASLDELRETLEEWGVETRRRPKA